MQQRHASFKRLLHSRSARNREMYVPQLRGSQIFVMVALIGKGQNTQKRYGKNYQGSTLHGRLRGQCGRERPRSCQPIARATTLVPTSGQKESRTAIVRGSMQADERPQILTLAGSVLS